MRALIIATIAYTIGTAVAPAQSLFPPPYSDEAQEEQSPFSSPPIRPYIMPQMYQTTPDGSTWTGTPIGGPYSFTTIWNDQYGNSVSCYRVGNVTNCY